jgi:hypothetical protein
MAVWGAADQRAAGVRFASVGDVAGGEAGGRWRVDWHLTMLTRRGAERWTRLVHNVPEHVGLGWRPYTYLVTRGAVSQAAFHRGADVKRWLSARGLRVVAVHRRYDANSGPDENGLDQRSWNVGIARLEARS